MRIDDNTGEPLSGETRLQFDALRVAPAGDPTDPNDPVQPREDDPNDDANPNQIGGGCQLGTDGSANTLLLLFLGLLLTTRRRRS